MEFYVFGFVTTIPGTFRSKWGIEVWRKVRKQWNATLKSMTSASYTALLDTCENPGVFPTREVWRTRTRDVLKRWLTCILC